MVRNCSELLKSSSEERDNDYKLGSQLHPLNDGQRFWFLTDNEDSDKLCLYIRDEDYANRAVSTNARLSHDDSFSTQPFTSSSDLSLPTGAVIQVYTPTELTALTDSEKETEPFQWPQKSNLKGYRWGSPTPYIKLFRGLDVDSSGTSSTTGSTLYGLNMAQAQAEALYQGLERLHSNGHYKYYATDNKRLYLNKEGHLHDTIEFYIFSDDLFLVGDRLPFISHGNVTGSISTDTVYVVNTEMPLIDYSKLKSEAVFFCYRFRYTITA